jgi:hypothetical protein
LVLLVALVYQTLCQFLVRHSAEKRCFAWQNHIQVRIMDTDFRPIRHHSRHEELQAALGKVVKRRLAATSKCAGEEDSRTV